MVMRRLFTPEQETRMRSEHEAGVSLGTLAKRNGGCHQTIAAAVRRAGGTVRGRREASRFNAGRPRIVPDEHRAGMVQLYQQGYTKREAAGAFGWTAKVCDMALREAGVKCRRSGVPSGWMKHSVDEQAEIVAMYESGMSANEIAAARDVSDITVATVLCKNGVSLRTHSEACRTYGVNERFFERIDTPEKAWLLGLIAADGNVSKRSHAVTLVLHRKDRECLERVAKLLEYEGPIHDYADEDGNGRSVLSIGCKRLASDLKWHGIMPAKSLILKPWSGPAHLMGHYFRGLVDGDGWVRFQEGYSPARSGRYARWDIGLCGTQAVVTAFADYVSSYTRSRSRPRRHHQCPHIYLVVYGGSGLPQQVARLLYEGATCYLRRKKSVADDLLSRQVQRKYRKPQN